MISAGLYLVDRQGLWTVPGLADLELGSVDARFRLRGPQQPRSDDIVVVGLDDQARRRHVDVFQTRRGWSRLIDAIDAHRPRAIGLDVLYDAPEVALPLEVVADARAVYDELRATPELPPAALKARDVLAAVVEETRGDDMLAQAIERSGRVYLGLLFHLANDVHGPAAQGAREPDGADRARYGEWVATTGPAAKRPPAAYYVSSSLPAFAGGAKGAGALNVYLDDDGNVRRVYGVIDYGGRYYMPLGLVMALEALGADGSYVAGQRHIRVGNRSLPVSARGEMFLSYLGPGKSFRHVSAADVLDDKIPAEALAGKLVFVGFTDASRDKVPTPFDPQLDGVEIHALLAHNVLHGELLRRTGPVMTLLTMLILGAAVTGLQLRRVRRRRAWMPGVTALLIIAGYVIVAALLFSERGVVVEVAAPVLACVLITLTSLVAALATEGREKAQLRTAFSQYVNDTLVERLLADPNRATLGGERRELTVLFSDIRGFSSFSEQLEPEVLSDYLNQYLTPMTELVMNEGGMLDKYIGDAVMAVYGAPIEMSDHAQRACHTALAMLDALGPLNARWREHGLPQLKIGIGLNSGPMSVGNMGSEARFDYTVLGDSVNLGARLEGLTKVYRVDVLVGEETASKAGSLYVFRELDWVRVKGRMGTARVYELVGAREQAGMNADDLALFASALEAYRAADWAEASAGFSGFLERFPDDGPAQVMLERIRTLSMSPPSDWDGVFEQISK